MENLLNSTSGLVDQLAKILNTTAENVMPTLNAYMEMAINQKISANLASLIVCGILALLFLIITIIILIKCWGEDETVFTILTILPMIMCTWIVVNSIIVLNNIQYYVIQDILYKITGNF
jgi:hypothetical protein